MILNDNEKLINIYAPNLHIRKIKFKRVASRIYKIFYKISKIYKYVTNIIAFIILFIARKLYIKSLLGCNGDEFLCVLNGNLNYILDDIYYFTLSFIYFFIFLFFLQIKFCSKYQLIIFLLIIFELICKDHGDNFLHHGILNFSALFILLILGEFLILIFILIILFLRKKKYLKLFLFCILIIISFLLFSISNFENYYCKNWDRGLNGTYIDNDKSLYSCSILIPKNKCLINIISPFLDISKLLNIKCEKRDKKEKYLLKEISSFQNKSDVKRIGYPITIGNKEEIKGSPAPYSNSLLTFLKINLINMDEFENKNISNVKKPEVIVDFNENEFGKLNININYNEKLAKTRLELSKNNNSNNIIFLFMDNLSRAHFYRQFKKTSKFLKQFFSYKGFSLNSQQTFHGFEFLKYHKFDGATLTNAIPMFSGVYYDPKNRMVSIVKDLKHSGYITCNSQDICHKELMGIGNIDNYSYIEFDHEYASPNCDPNIYSFSYGLIGGENSILKKCLYGKESIEYTFEYSKKFWLAYKKNKKFLRIVNTYAHEYSGEKSKYTDEITFNFLNDLFLSNQLENTTIFLAGDHGFALMGVYKLLSPKDWMIERFMPIFILLVPDSKKMSYEEQYSEILKNQQTLITPFDIYYTIRHIIYGNNYKNNLLKEQNYEGESLFKYINPKERNCTKYLNFTGCICVINT